MHRFSLRGGGKMTSVRLLFGLVALAATQSTSRAGDLPPEHVEFFETKIRPIFVEHCYKCHSAESGKSKGSLTLDSREALRKGGGSGPVIVPGDPAKSLLLDAVKYTDEDLQMPPKEEGGQLAPEKIAALEQWIKMGAPDPRVGEAKSAAMNIAKARQHWAFQPVVKPAVPAVKNSRWVNTPVDAFILAQLEARGLAPAAPADRRTLLRRVTYDLTGLPPTTAEMDAFLADRDPRAYDRVVERLLASPQYGERWGRYWLDVARYADTKGYLAGNVERRYAFSHTYRDYVIQAFNEDKPYDRFIVEQLAADQLPAGEDKSALAALGFLTLGRRFLNNQNDIIDDRIDVVTRGLMGLTVTCARCHDHKFDPIPTADYYSLHGVFASSDEPAEKPLLKPLTDSPAYEEFLKKQAELEGRIKAREAEEVNKFLAGVREKTGSYLLAVHDLEQLPAAPKLDQFSGPRKLNVEALKRWQAFLADKKSHDNPALAPWFALAALPEGDFAAQAAELIARWKAETATPGVVVKAFTEAEKPIASLKDAAAVYDRVFTAAGKAGTPVANPIHQLLYADGAPPNFGYEAVATMLKRQIDTKVSGLRREIEALNWTEPGAPLRAMALTDKPRPKDSHIFLRGNPANPGPEVPRRFLEVLAREQRAPFAHGSGRLDLAEDIADPKNPLTARVFVNRVWGWHFGAALVRTPSDFGVRTEAPPQRQLLDWLAATFVAGNWSVKQLHRAIVRSSAYRQSSDATPAALAADPDNLLIHHVERRRLDLEAMRDTLLAVAGTLDLRAGGIPDDLTKEPFATRRTVYGFVDRQNLPGMFRTFDYPNPDVSSAQRFATTVPQQALFLMNSAFAQQMARALARRPEIAAAKSDRERIAALYRVAYQRGPEAEELKLAESFLRRPAAAPGALRTAAGGWQYGFGRFDAAANRVRDFHPMEQRKEGRVSPSAKYPDAPFGFVSITAVGGHAGRTPEFASIRRWIAPAKGKVAIAGTLGHGMPGGDGVCGRIVASETGRAGEWTAHNSKVVTKLELEVEGGETLDFIVDCIGDESFDGYTWAPTIAFTPDPEAIDMAARTYNAKNDFERESKLPPPLTRWEELAQVILLSNELAFLD
jgi:hypothetical protein